MESTKAQQPLRIAVFGSRGAGKTTLLYQMTKWIFADEIDMIIPEMWLAEVQIDGKPRQVELIDYSGVIEEHSCPLWKNFIQMADCVVLVSAELVPESKYGYSEPHQYIEDAIAALFLYNDEKPHIPLCFWHNKADTIDPAQLEDRKTYVYRALSHYFNSKVPATLTTLTCPDSVFMVSAKTRHGVDSALQDAAKKAFKYKKQQQQQDSSSQKEEQLLQQRPKQNKDKNRCRLS